MTLLGEEWDKEIVDFVEGFGIHKWGIEDSSEFKDLYEKYLQKSEVSSALSQLSPRMRREGGITDIYESLNDEVRVLEDELLNVIGKKILDCVARDYFFYLLILKLRKEEKEIKK